jgi:hypothetical protein
MLVHASEDSVMGDSRMGDTAMNDSLNDSLNGSANSSVNASIDDASDDGCDDDADLDDLNGEVLVQGIHHHFVYFVSHDHTVNVHCSLSVCTVSTVLL